MARYEQSLAFRFSAMAERICSGRRSPNMLEQPTGGEEPANTMPKQTGLYELPLVLVQDILEQLVIQNTQLSRKDRITMPDLLELRRVNKLFDSEIMKHLGRNFVQRSDALNKCMWRAPVTFTVKVLKEFIGESLRRDSCVFPRRMHASMDTLLEELQAIGTPKERREVLDYLCLALAKRRHRREYFQPAKPTQNLFRTAAFVIAVAAGYNDVVAAMLEARTIKVNERNDDFGYLMDMAIVLGNVEGARLLIRNGAALDNRSWSHTCQALGQAAGEGYSALIDFIFDYMPPDMDHETFYTIGKVICRAAECQQWGIVKSLLDTHLEDIQIQEGKTLLCLAARYGQDDVIEKLLEPGIWDYDCTYLTYKNFPLREAVEGGHLSICLLLIERDLIKHVGPHRGEVMARFIAKGGNVDVYHRLRELKPDLWKEWQEIHFLPVAAYTGHLEFAKLAVERRCDRRPKYTHGRPSAVLNWEGEIRYPEDLRYFALLCAVIMGHMDVARWLIQEIGVDVNNESGRRVDAGLVPVTLAVLAGQAGMAKLLTRDLGAKPPPKDVSTKLWDMQYSIDIGDKLDRYRQALHLRDDYKLWRPSERKARVAWKATLMKE